MKGEKRPLEMSFLVSLSCSCNSRKKCHISCLYYQTQHLVFEEKKYEKSKPERFVNLKVRNLNSYRNVIPNRIY